VQTKLYGFQSEDCRRINREFDGRCLIANSVGTGKTVICLNYIWKYLPEDPPGPIVVVVPSHLLINWQREAKKHIGVRAEILTGETVPLLQRKPKNPNQMFVISYRCLVPAGWKPSQPLPANSWAKWLLDQNPRLLICDEAHACKSSSTARTKAIKKMSQSISGVLLLTGTPLTNSPKDMWSLCNILWPREFPSESNFLHEFTFGRREWYGWVFKGAKNLNRLHQKLLDLGMIRRRKEDVLQDLPEVQHSVIPLEVPLTDYRRAENDFLRWLQTEAPHLSRGAAKAEEIVKLSYLKQFAGRLKIDGIVDWVKSFLEESGGKILIGSVHHEFTDTLRSKLKNCIQVDGRNSTKEKQWAFDAFNNDLKYRVLIGNLQAAGTGWSCTSTSDAAVAEYPYVPSDVDQFCGRVTGINRGIVGRGSHIRYFTAVGTADEDLCRILQEKSRWAAQVVDGSPDIGSMDIADQMIEAIKQRQERGLG